MNRPRRALLEEPEDEGDHVAHVPRRSSGFAPAPDEPSRQPEPDDDEGRRRSRRAARRRAGQSPNVVVPASAGDRQRSPPPPEPPPSAPDRPTRGGTDHDRPAGQGYNGILAVRNLSFTVEPGRITGFLGPNGAGKTTTLRILVGLASPTTGTATFGGTPYAELDRPQETVGAVLDANFHPGRTGRNHLRVLAATAGVTDRRVDELLDRVGLTDDARRPTGHYSLGMRQRLAIAAALIGDPDYLILDEPANGLDPEGIRWLRQVLRDFADRPGRSGLLAPAQRGAGHGGRDRGDPQRPAAGPDAHDGPAARPGDHPRPGVRPGYRRAGARSARRSGRAGVDEQGPYLRVHSQEVAAVGAALFNAGIVVHELVTERRDLEQEFFAMLEASR